MADCKARIDSFYHGSAVDGEGLRSVLFFSGCNLRCPFCHNPETLYGSGKEISLDEAVATVKRYVPYMKKGGLTLSGGEPFLQAEFCAFLADEVHKLGITVIAETNGMTVKESLIRKLDGVRLDIKNQRGENGEQLIARYTLFLKACEKHGVDVLLTNVLIPDVNDNEESVVALAKLKEKFDFCRGVEFLPFMKLCEEKYRGMGLEFPYATMREATREDIEKANSYFSNKLKFLH